MKTIGNLCSRNSFRCGKRAKEKSRIKHKRYDWTDVHHFQFHCNWMANKSRVMLLYLLNRVWMSFAVQVKMVRKYVTSVDEIYLIKITISLWMIHDHSSYTKKHEKKCNTKSARAQEKCEWNYMHFMLMAVSWTTVQPDEVNYIRATATKTKPKQKLCSHCSDVSMVSEECFHKKCTTSIWKDSRIH